MISMGHVKTWQVTSVKYLQTVNQENPSAVTILDNAFKDTSKETPSRISA